MSEPPVVEKDRDPRRNVGTLGCACCLCAPTLCAVGFVLLLAWGLPITVEPVPFESEAWCSVAPESHTDRRRQAMLHDLLEHHLRVGMPIGRVRRILGADHSARMRARLGSGKSRTGHYRSEYDLTLYERGRHVPASEGRWKATWWIGRERLRVFPFDAEFLDVYFDSDLHVVAWRFWKS
ncbi:MAG: hypothetical protein GY711_01680 [bacterium]|nr:hypothetical protein [bacterium]